MLGPIPLSGAGLALAVALPFGNTSAATLIALADAAQDAGILEIRPAPNRALLLICPSEIAADTMRDRAAALGFVVDTADPRARIAACPGAPACASGHLAAREIAGMLASALADCLDKGRSLHVSGCAKGCARQAPADITIVGGENGAGLVVNGTARDRPVAYSSQAELAAKVAALLQVARAAVASKQGRA